MDALSIVLGLGNPGQTYRSTRHNMGFWVLDRLAERSGVAFRAESPLRRYARLAEIRVGNRETVLSKPRTYMNRAGRAAAALCRTYGLEPRELVVVYDDADLALGRVRLRRGGGAGGHNGVRSLIEVLGQVDFARVRLGIRGPERDREELADYVLSPFLDSEVPVAEALAEAGADAVECLLQHGLAEAMNRFNGMQVGAEGEVGPVAE